MPMKPIHVLVAATATATLTSLGAMGLPRAHAQGPSSAPAPLPTAVGPTGGPVTQIMVQGGNRALLRIAVPRLLGADDLSTSVVETASRDFTLSSIFQVLDPKSFTANVQGEGLGIDVSSWRNVGAEGVVKGSTTSKGNRIKLELRLYVLSRGAEPVLKREYEVEPGGIRGAVHKFDNEVVKWFTGIPGTFGSRLVFSANTGKGQKGIFAIESDGHGLARLATPTNVALAPAIGNGGIYYSGALPDGGYALFRVGTPTPVLRHAGLVFGVAFGASKMALVVSQNGESDILVGAPESTDLKKVTTGGLNTHPAFGPGGQMAYVSSVGGSPQIFVDGKRISWRGTYNMAPVWCNDPEGPRILFMGRDGNSWDIFSVDAAGGNMKRITQDQGSNTYPACSPDGRTIAFFSSRGGLFLANSQGQNQQQISTVTGESLRWESN